MQVAIRTCDYTMTNKEYIKYLLDAKTQCIWIKTYEEARVIEDLREIIFDYKDENKMFSLNMWSITEGLSELPIVDTDDENLPNLAFKNPDILFGQIKESHLSKENKNIVWVLRDLDKVFNNTAFLTRHVRDLKEYGGFNTFQPLIIISANNNIPKDLEKIVTIMDYDLLDYKDIYNMIEQFVSNIADAYSCLINISLEEKQNIAKTLMGFTYLEIVTLLRKNYVKEGTLSYSFMIKEKIKLIQRTDVLKFKVPEINFSDIGGNDNFKEWVETVKSIFCEEAKEYGCSPLKGYLAFGIPGSAKTMSAEALAGELNVPFIKFDSSKILSKLVGESEKNIEEALRLVRASAPCVFLIDEVEKILGGIASSNKTDGGTTARIVASILQFLDEDDLDVITVMTSNDISQLPPELTRSGRLDAVWYFGIPGKEERESIFRIHLDKTGKHYNDEVIKEIASKTDQYTGAEIKNIVKKSVWNSYQRFLEDEINGITIADLENAKEEIIPIINTYKEKISYLEQWAKTRARNASKKESTAIKSRKNILKI